MQRVLVTGGAGFIGSHIVDALVDRGLFVRVLDQVGAHPANLAHVEGKVEIVVGSVADVQIVTAAMEGIDTVFHQAALASVPVSVERPLDSHAVCCTGTANVLDAARRAGVKRVVYAASSACYGDLPGDVKREDSPLAPLSPYAAAKLAGELYCQAFHSTYGLETVRLRYFNVFGPRQAPDGPYAAVIPRFLDKMLRGQPITIFGDGLQTRDFIYVADVVRANLLAAETPGVGGEVFNVAGGKAVNLLDLVRDWNRILGMSVQPVHEPARAGEVRNSLADVSKAKRLLGFEPQVSLFEGMQRLAGSVR